MLRIRLFAVIAALLICVGCQATPLEKRIDDIQRSEKTCFENACNIAEARAQYNLPTNIVLAFASGEAIGAQGWHAYWRDENGELYDTVRQYVDWDHFPPMAYPLLEFQWKPDMVLTQDGKTLEAAPYFKIEFESAHWSTYRIVYGKEFIKKLD
jgi:hypothetical protein